MFKVLRLGFVVLVVGAALATAVPKANPSSSPEGRLSLADVAFSVDYLTSTYGVTVDEALERMELQQDVPSLVSRVRSAQPDDYAGAWLDQENGGVLTVASTDPARASEALRGYPHDERVRVRSARWSLSELRATADQLSARLGAGVDVHVDQQRNRVNVHHDGPVPLDGLGSDADAVEVLPPLPKVQEQMAVMPNRKSATAQGDCYVLMCRAPMRGGVRLDIPRLDPSGNRTGWGVCTNGFNVVETETGSVYTLTAGHCIEDTSEHHKPETDRSFHMRIPVGVEDRDLTADEPSPTFDYAFMPYFTEVLAQEWVKNHRGNQNLLHTWCREDSNEVCSSSGDRRVTGVMTNANQVVPNQVVCATGSSTEFTGGRGWFPGTRCGLVRTVTDSQVFAHICSRPGDSGGPLFLEGANNSVTAIGILEGSQGTTTLRGRCVGRFNETSNYTRIDQALNRVNGRTQRDFRIITGTL